MTPSSCGLCQKANPVGVCSTLQLQKKEQKPDATSNWVPKPLRFLVARLCRLERLASVIVLLAPFSTPTGKQSASVTPSLYRWGLPFLWVWVLSACVTPSRWVLIPHRHHPEDLEDTEDTEDTEDIIGTQHDHCYNQEKKTVSNVNQQLRGKES